MLVLWCAQALFRARHHTPTNDVPTKLVATNAPAHPWGELEITPLVLDRPEEFFLTNSWDRVIRWSFPNSSAKQIEALLNSCDLTAEQRRPLLDTNRWDLTTNGWCILPPPEVVKAMTPTTREKIYSVLAQSPENINQHWAFFYRADGFDEWLAYSELPPDSVELVRSLCYTRNRRLYFADTQLFELLRSTNETRRLVRTLARVPTLMMKLRVRPDSNLNALMEYWGRFRKDEEIDYLLRSMARVEEGAALNISYFMPPVPRLRLYTYPEPGNAERHDCFWTAFNFFSDEPAYQLSGPADYNKLLQSDFRPVNGPKMFGDLLLLLESGETAAHMCVYIAADVVYTKNGTDPKQPWVLMRTKDMMTLYTSDKPQQWRTFRKIGT